MKTYYLIGPNNETLAGPFKTEESAQRAQVLHPQGEIRDSEEMQAVADAHNCHDNQQYSETGPWGAGSYCSVCGENVWYFPR